MSRTDGQLIHEFMIRLDRTGENDALAVMHASRLTLPQIVALTLLEHHGPVAVSTLADHLRMSMSATSSLVQRLVEEKLISRVEFAGDRRQKRLALTRQGAALIARITAERTRALGQGIATLPRELRAEVLEVIGRVVGHLRSRA